MQRSTMGIMLTLALGLLWTPLVATAQPAGHVWRMGVLDAGAAPSVPSTAQILFWQAMHELGWVEGQNITVERRYAEGHDERLPALAVELVRLPVDVVLAGSTAAALALKQATTTIPIVMATMNDPVGSGLVASLAQPGGNMTGVAVMDPEVIGKQLEFLKDVLPTVSRVAVLSNPANPAAALMVRAAEVAAPALGVQLHLVEAGAPEAFDSVFAAMTRAHTEALLVLPDASVFFTHRRRLVELAATSRLPTMYSIRPFVEAGGLISYGVSRPDQFQGVARYVDKILKGAKPADLPVEQPMKFELVINLKTAQELGLTIPPTLLFQADEIIR